MKNRVAEKLYSYTASNMLLPCGMMIFLFPLSLLPDYNVKLRNSFVNIPIKLTNG
jgi:hypothetical protein